MYDTEMGNDRVIHVLPKQWLVVEGIEGNSVRTGPIGQRSEKTGSREYPTASANPAATSWVLSHQCVELVRDRSRRPWCELHAEPMI